MKKKENNFVINTGHYTPNIFFMGSRGEKLHLGILYLDSYWQNIQNFLLDGFTGENKQCKI